MSVKNQKSLIVVGGVVVALLVGSVLLGGFTKSEPAPTGTTEKVGCPVSGCDACPAAKTCGSEKAEAFGSEETCPSDCEKPCCAEQPSEGCCGGPKPCCPSGPPAGCCGESKPTACCEGTEPAAQ